MTKVDLFHNLRVKFNELSLREYTIVEEVIEELQGETETTKELEKENALLKGRNEGFEQQIMGLLIKYEEVYKRFPDLKSAMDKAQTILKENAELKAQLQKKINTTTVSDYPYSALKLEEAKEIIKKLYSHVFLGMGFMEINDYNVQKAEAEQFLKENE